jgi:hypothetical protein
LSSWARRFALASAGSSIAARMAMIAMTTSNSIKVKPERELFFDEKLTVMIKFKVY